MTLRLHTIVASTRPGRVGSAVGRWFHTHAEASDAFDAHLVELARFALPVYDEPKHPSKQDYAHAHTRSWAESVAAADAFVFVTPEYNFNPTPALVNALTYLYLEWNYKPAAFVSYGGVSGGLRAVQSAKLLLSTLKVVPIVESVTIPFVSKSLEDGAFKPNELQTESAGALLKELARWTEALKPLRNDATSRS